MDAFDFGLYMGFGMGIGAAWTITDLVIKKFNIKGWYNTGCIASATIVFFTLWGTCIGEYGFLLGVGLGWLPSAIVAFALCWMWPLFLVGIAFLLVTYLVFPD